MTSSDDVLSETGDVPLFDDLDFEEDATVAMPAPAPVSSRMALNAHKAGMQNCDQERINKVILEASKDSKFFENERKKEAATMVQAHALKDKLNKLKASDIAWGGKEAERWEQILLGERDLTNVVVHLDMDAFYAAVEERDRPELKKVPLGVGSNSMLSTSNYVARQYGVRAAMPGFIAKKLCPNLVIVPLSFDRYKAASKKVEKVLEEYDPNVRMMSLDEGYLNITQHLAQRVTWPASQRTHRILQDDGSLKEEEFGVDAEAAVEEMRARVYTETEGLTCSAGIAPNSLLAKICSDRNKPNGQFILKSDWDVIKKFMQDLPVRKVSGIGKVTEQLLSQGLGVTTCGDLYIMRDRLVLLFSSTTFQYFLRVSLGIGAVPRPDDSAATEQRKSISCERTFSEVSSKDALLDILKSLCEELSDDMKKRKIRGKSLTLKVKLTSFEIKTKSCLLPRSVNESEDLLKNLSLVFENFLLEFKGSVPSVRLIGVRAAKLEKSSKCQKSVLDLMKNKSSKSSTAQNKGNELLEGRTVEASKNVTKKKPAGRNLFDSDTNILPETSAEINLFDLTFPESPLRQENDNESKLPTDGAHMSIHRTNAANLEEDGLESLPSETHGPNGGPADNKDGREVTLFEPIDIHSEESNGEVPISDRPTCPICCERISEDVADINEHIDQCLSKDLSQESQSPAPVPSSSSVKPSTSSVSSKREKVLCPICDLYIDMNESINTHVDSCLTRKEVRRVLKEQNHRDFNRNVSTTALPFARGGKRKATGTSSPPGPSSSSTAPNAKKRSSGRGRGRPRGQAPLFSSRGRSR